MRPNISILPGHGLEDIISLNGPIAASELADIFIGTDFLLIPSRIESIPVVFSDSIQSGVPVITMPVGDLPDIVARYECGICASDVSAAAFASAINNAFVKGKREFMPGVELARKQFDIAASVNNWINE